MLTSEEIQQQIDHELIAIGLGLVSRNTRQVYELAGQLLELVAQLKQAAFEEGREKGEIDAREESRRPLST